MDFTELEVVKDTPAFLQFKHPITGEFLTENGEQTGTDENGEPVFEQLPVGVRIWGVDSDKFKARKRALMDERLKMAQQQANRGQKPTLDLNVKAVEASNELTLLACIEGFVRVSFRGVDIGSDPKLILEFIRACDWARDQTDTGIMDRANFLKVSRKSL